MTDTQGLTWGYLFAAVGFASLFVVGPLILLAVDRVLARRDRRVSAALQDEAVEATLTDRHGPARSRSTLTPRTLERQTRP